MCINFKLFKSLFSKKQNEPSEDVILENTILNEEVVPENEVVQEQQEELVEQEEEPILAQQSEPLEKPQEETEETKFVVLLDNGHAKSTAGKRSPVLDNGERFYEWEFNRDVVNRIAKGLDELKIKYHILVPEVDEDVKLSERAKRANKYCKEYGTEKCFLISVHSNAFGKDDKWETPGKWSVWTTVGVTKSDEYGKIMYEVAEEMLKPYEFGCRDGKVQGNGNDGPDYEENFTILYKTWCPAVLTENLFYTNKKECEWLMTDIGRQVIADIHIEGIRRIIDSL